MVPKNMRLPQRILSVIALLVCVFALAPAQATPPPLTDLAKGLNIDKKAISVSGISSGAFMAHQFHIAHSENIMGAGIMAGGPYYCSRGSVLRATNKCASFGVFESICRDFEKKDQSRCNKDDGTPQNEAQVKQLAQESFAEAKKQNPSIKKNVENDKVYLFSGKHDALVPTGVMDTVHDLYTAPDKLAMKKERVRYNKEFPARHTVVRDNFNRPEEKTAVGKCAIPPEPVPPMDEYPFIDDCQKVAQQEMEKAACESNDSGACKDLRDTDLAGAILKHIYGKEALASERVATKEDQVLEFDQRRIFKKFFPDGWRNKAEDASMAHRAYVFIPKTCKEGKKCKLHVAIHGCLQGGKTDNRPGHSGNLFAKFGGYNEWAETNGIVVLYPQVERREVPPPLNPQGCWDWWGQDYTHEKYHTKEGPQIRAVAEMINVLVGEELLEVAAK